MFDPKPVDPFEKLLSRARGIVSERAKILDAVQENEASLSTEQAILEAARKRVNDEEFAAAQAPGSLAVASKAALQAVADAEVRVKSVRLRLKGLQPKLAAVDENLSAVRGELGELLDTFLFENIAELGAQFDEAISQVMRLFCKAHALQRFCGERQGQKFKYRPILAMLQTVLANPVSAKAMAISGGLFTTPEQKCRAISDHWLEDPEAEKLHREILAIKDRIAEIGGAEAAGEGQGA